MRLYRALLRVLPRDIRERHGLQMTLVFGELLASAKAAGLLGRAHVWLAEMSGLAKFALRARFGSRRGLTSTGSPAPGPGWTHDLYWALRHVRARGGRAVLIVALLAIALAANTLIFSVADSTVFNRLPFHRADRLVGFLPQLADPGTPAGGSLTAPQLEQWRQHTDVFAGIETYLTKTLFLAGEGRHEAVATADVTPGMMALLGVAPKWGRDLAVADAVRAEADVALIAESLARARFGDPAAALGQTLQSSAGPIAVVGVMPDVFHFPSQSQRIWRALDPRGPLARNFGGTFAIARLRDGVSVSDAAAIVASRSAVVGQAAGSARPHTVTTAPHAIGTARPDARRFWLLLGAALALLAIACASVTGVELAGAIARARTSAIHLALGASRFTLARVAIFEAGLLFLVALLLGGLAAYAGLQVISTQLLPPAIVRATPNAIDLDARSLLFIMVLAACAWLATLAPILWRTHRADLLALLKLEDRSSTASAGGIRLRRALTVVQVALAVALAMSAILWARSYTVLLSADKGFESRNIASITYTLPPQFYPTMAEKRVLERQLLEKLAAMPGVLAVAAGAPPTGALEKHADVRALVDERPADPQGALLGLRYVDHGYFAVLGIPLIRGRLFDTNEPPANAIVSASFARRYWGDADPIGRTFRQSERHRPASVIGVVGDLRLRPPDMTDAPPPSLDVYYPRQPPPAAVTAQRASFARSGGSYGYVVVMARLDSPARVRAARDMAVAVEPRFDVEVELVDDEYAAQFAPVLLVTRIVGAFGVLSVLVALLGLYGVMTLLVTARRREIGVRMALGATRADVGRLVVASSARLIAAGVVIGVGGAIAIGRATRTLLYGISPWDPITIAGVSAIVVATGIMASARPAHHATRVDPSSLLRS